MANRTTLGTLAGQVQDLLRTSDKTSEAVTWVNTALSELYSRTTGIMSRRAVQFSITSSAAGEAAFVVNTICPNFVSPISLFMVLNQTDQKIYTPAYLPPHEFFQTCSWKTGVSQASQIDWYTISRVGTNTPSATLSDLKALTLYLDPGIVISTTRWCYLTYLATPLWQTDTTKFIECLPHWEHVVVWKAAALGARALKHRLYDIFEIEAEHAIQTMYTVEKYQPDTLAISQGVDGNMAGTRRFRYALPEQIQAP